MAVSFERDNTSMTEAAAFACVVSTRWSGWKVEINSNRLGGYKLKGRVRKTPVESDDDWGNNTRIVATGEQSITL